MLRSLDKDMRETDPAHRDGMSNYCRENLGFFEG